MSQAPGEYNGRHFTQWVDTVKDLKRQDRLDEAAELLDGLMAATIAEGRAENLTPAPWYFEQAAIVAEKQGDLGRAHAALAHYVDVAGDGAAPHISERLRKLETKMAMTVLPTGACPACGVVLDPPPKRTRRCPHCRETITVKTVDGTRRLLSPDQVRELEAEERRIKILAFANRIGINEDQFNARAETTANLGDTFWSLANERTHNIAPTMAHHWLELRDVYRVQADFLEFEGRDPSTLDRLAVVCGLRYDLAAHNPPADQTIRVVGCDCEPCGYGEQTWRIGDLDPAGTLPVPHVGCTRGRCKCWFWLEPDAKNALSRTLHLHIDASDLTPPRTQGLLGRLKGRWSPKTPPQR